MAYNGLSVVDYAVVSEGLLSSVKYFKTSDFNYLSDHSQIELFLKCKWNAKHCNIFSENDWSKTAPYRWDPQKSKLKLLNILSENSTVDQIVDFEIQDFTKDQKGVDDATNKISKILNILSENSCSIRRNTQSKKTKIKKKHSWSDNSITELKHQINVLGRKINTNPYDNTYRIRYFSLLKSFKKQVKQKKARFKEELFKKLEDSFQNKTQEYWKILKNMKHSSKIDDEPDDIFFDLKKLEEHFQNQGNCITINEEFKKQIVNELKNMERKILYNEVTDKPFTISEVKKVINNLKTGKSCGPDNIINEIIKFSSQVTLKAFTKLFNIILRTGCYPKVWEQSYIIPIHKSGDRSDFNNYRGISLMSCLAKVFSALINNRLTDFMDSQYNHSQFGFRKNHRTSDSLFILKSIINKYLHKNKRKLFICFVDFQKAFDSLWRLGLLYKLCKSGIGKGMFDIIKNQFNNTLCSFKHKDMFSTFFNTDKGVRQGDGISPTLFNIFINDISQIFEQENCTPVKLINSKLGSLLFADDLIILSETQIGLQKSLDNLSEYCNNWQLTVNVKKTKTMIIQNNPPKIKKSFIKYKGQFLENVNTYKYLGCVVNCNGSLISCSQDLANKARKVLFAIRSYTSEFCQVPVRISCNLFNSLVKPILTYNSEICYMDSYLKLHRAKLRAKKNNSDINVLSFIDKSPLEKIQLHFIKHTLGTKKTATNLAVRAEIGMLPLETFIMTQTILYFLRLNNDSLNPLLKEAYDLTKSLDKDGIYSWYTYAKNISEESKIDLELINNCKTIKQVKNIKPVIKKSVINYYKNIVDDQINNLNDSNKNYLYKFLKINNNEEEYYLSHPNKDTRKILTKFRVSDHELLIETGRYKKIPREQRKCQVCNNIDDEFHFFFNCKLNRNARESFMKYLEETHNNFNNLSATEKLITILNPSTPLQIKTVVSFIVQSLELRKGDP